MLLSDIVENHPRLKLYPTMISFGTLSHYVVFWTTGWSRSKPQFVYNHIRYCTDFQNYFTATLGRSL